MSYSTKTLSEFTAELASPAPVPGGGGASALAGSIGAALGDMVGELTIGKKKYIDVEEEIKAAMAQAQDLRIRFLDCIEKDAEAFEPLSKAYGIPKDDPTRSAVMEECLKNAAAAPLEILRLACETIELEKIFAEKGSKLMISDAATGAALCRAALTGAAVNVKINTRSMKDREYADSINKEVDEKVARYTALADEVFMSVYSRY